MKKIAPLLKLILTIALIATGGLLVVAHRQAQQLLSHPLASRQAASAAPQATLTSQALELTTADQFRIQAHYVATRNGATIVLCHGYKMDHNEMLPIAAMLAQNGYGVLLFDWRGHGLSSGEQISFGLHEWRDLEAAINFIASRQPDSTIGLFGNSMGAALCLDYAARDPRVAAVVAQSPYASLAHSINNGVRRFTGLPPFPFAPLIKFFAERQLGSTLDSVAPIHAMAKISPRPVLLMMGGLDRSVEPSGIFALQQAAGAGTELWYDAELGHVDFYRQHPAEFERRLLSFYRCLLQP